VLIRAAREQFWKCVAPNCLVLEYPENRIKMAMANSFGTQAMLDAAIIPEQLKGRIKP
jgi:hypothetical protein